MTMKNNTVLLNSSVIHSASYMASKRQLTITFNSGAKYLYKGVPSDVAQDLVSADSVGKFFSSNIKGIYDSEAL